MRTNASTPQKALDAVVSLRKGSYVCISNVHMCMETFYDESFLNVVNSADLIFADGRPILWAQQLFGAKDVQQVRGQNLMMQICDYASKNNKNIGLYGGDNDDELALVINKLKKTFPDLNVSYAYSPPFRVLNKSENEVICKNIKDSNVDFLFVGIGCPKQEIWMHNFSKEIETISLGVGAAFNFISGSKKHAPKWMQQMGLEWFFRLCCEPKRLWKRYLKHNPRFVYYFLKQLISKKTKNKN